MKALHLVFFLINRFFGRLGNIDFQVEHISHYSGWEEGTKGVLLAFITQIILIERTPTYAGLIFNCKGFISLH